MATTKDINTVTLLSGMTGAENALVESNGTLRKLNLKNEFDKVEERINESIDDKLSVQSTSVNLTLNGRSGALNLSKYGNVVVGSFTGIFDISTAGLLQFNSSNLIIPVGYRPNYACFTSVPLVVGTNVQGTARFLYSTTGKIEMVCSLTGMYEFSHCVTWITA